MAQSREFPELQFIPPRAFGRGRDGRSVKLSVVHYTAGSERSTSAEDGAAYDQRRTDGTSTHLFHDSNSTVQCVYRWDRANAALYKGNRLGVQHELCGTQQTRAQWLDEASDATLWRAARYVADDCRTFGLQPRRLSVAETRATWYSSGPGGICGHWDITRAFPEDNGTHTDPGAEFPWDIFLQRVNLFLDGGSEMAISDTDFQAMAWRIVSLMYDTEQPGNGPVPNERNKLRDRLIGLEAKVDAVAADLAELQVTPSPEQWAQLTAAILDKVGTVAEAAAERAVRRVLGAVDGATPT